jgi:hypothetical protein
VKWWSGNKNFAGGQGNNRVTLDLNGIQIYVKGVLEDEEFT